MDLEADKADGRDGESVINKIELGRAHSENERRSMDESDNVAADGKRSRKIEEFRGGLNPAVEYKRLTKKKKTYGK